MSSKSQRVCQHLFKYGKHAQTLLRCHLIFSGLCLYAAECPPLGMESHKVEPDQLSASSVSQYSFSPQRARLNMQVYNNQGTTAEVSTRVPIKTLNRHQLRAASENTVIAESVTSFSLTICSAAKYLNQLLNV